MLCFSLARRALRRARCRRWKVPAHTQPVALMPFSLMSPTVHALALKKTLGLNQHFVFDVDTTFVHMT